MTVIVRIALLGAIVASFLPSIIVGQTPATDSLLRRTDALERQVAELERRVGELEELIKLTPSRTPPVPDARKWRNLANWRHLHRGMTMDQARELVGEPEKVEANRVRITWYWDFPAGADVWFDADSKKVEGWSEPSSR